MSAKCHSAHDVKTGDVVWNSSDHPETVLMSSCTTVILEDDVVKGWDCINGSVIPRRKMESTPKGDTNYTQLMSDFTGHGHEHREVVSDEQRVHFHCQLVPYPETFILRRGSISMSDHIIKTRLPSSNSGNLSDRLVFDDRVDDHGAVLPFDMDVTIYDESKLMINHEGCVNTLQKECDAFYAKFGRDGRNHSSPSRYPCFYAPNNPEVVVARFDLARTQYIFLMFFVVPASLLVVSCGVLLLCSRILNIDNTGHMVLRKVGGDEQEWEQELDILPQRKPTMRRPRRKSIFDTGEDDL